MPPWSFAETVHVRQSPPWRKKTYLISTESTQLEGCVCRGGEGRRGEGWGRRSLNGGHTHHYQVVSRGLLNLLFFCKDENPNVLYMNWDWFRYYIVNMFLASNDNINKRITLHECFHFERQAWQQSGNLELKLVSPYSLSTSYRRGRWFESHLGNRFFFFNQVKYIYLTWSENNIPQSRAFDSIYILPASFPLLVVPHAVITLETNRCYLEALCLSALFGS